MNKMRLVENNSFEIINETEGQGQSLPKSIWTLTVLGCILVQIMESRLQS